jgi:hypothetical protein
MTQQSEFPLLKKAVLWVGVALIVGALGTLAVLGFYLASRGNVFNSELGAGAVIFIDVPGRIGIDGTLQVEGPGPVPVSVGEHTIALYDSPYSEPLKIRVEQGEFRYVSNPTSSRGYTTSQLLGVVRVAAFPPNTTIEIPDCTPVGARYATVCKSEQSLNAELSPGTYTVQYVNPQFGEYAEKITVGADSVIRAEHSFISSVAVWNDWKVEHGDIIEQRYPSYYRSSTGGALLLPFEAAFGLADALF